MHHKIVYNCNVHQAEQHNCSLLLATKLGRCLTKTKRGPEVQKLKIYVTHQRLAMQQLSAKVFKSSFEYLHTYSPKMAIFAEKK